MATMHVLLARGEAEGRAATRSRVGKYRRGGSGRAPATPCRWRLAAHAAAASPKNCGFWPRRDSRFRSGERVSGLRVRSAGHAGRPVLVVRTRKLSCAWSVHRSELRASKLKMAPAQVLAATSYRSSVSASQQSSSAFKKKKSSS